MAKQLPALDQCVDVEMGSAARHSNVPPRSSAEYRVAIKCAQPTVMAGPRATLPIENDKACNALVELILRQVDN